MDLYTFYGTVQEEDFVSKEFFLNVRKKGFWTFFGFITGSYSLPQ